ncbi:hypothetical protein [Hyphomicrobium sp. CS1BSMeth3]|uniref:hypothetical protein n=1 Tax=Hyphomicrobium sp. CS1BSMeth3 TaxID=1892844 RepID=UPI0009318685|nr:hypothetical protein [Hyphomicrobium sp. CS1BSMeth3]
MSFTRHLIAFVLLLVLVPSLVLAAMPIKYCASSAGHQSLELVIGSIAHGGHDASHADTTDKAINVDDCGVALSRVEEDRCRDSELMNLAPAPGMLQLEVPEQPVAQHQVPQLSDIPSCHSMPVAFSRLGPDPRMSAHRTTVLRI